MSVSKWAYTPEVCDGEYCIGDCDRCGIVAVIAELMADEEGQDYISRQAAIEQAQRNFVHENQWVAREETRLLMNLPSADVRENVRGEWKDYQQDRWVYAQCSVCGSVHDVRSNFCPECGADMREGHD